MTQAPRITLETREHVLLIGLHRPDKRNAFDLAMLRQLGEAFTRFEEDPALRCAVLFGHGEHFPAGLDLAEVGPAVAAGQPLFPAGSVDPLGLGRARSKPLVLAVQGWCLTIGIELALAADIRLAAHDARFGQIEVKRGIFPFGGATLRMPEQLGWGDAMRWLLTGDIFDAAEALRIGLVQELCPPDRLLHRAAEIAATIARQAPLGVQATLRTAHAARTSGESAAIAPMMAELRTIMASDDAREGLQSFLERRDARFTGR